MTLPENATKLAFTLVLVAASLQCLNAFTVQYGNSPVTTKQSYVIKSTNPFPSPTFNTIFIPNLSAPTNPKRSYVIKSSNAAPAATTVTKPQQSFLNFPTAGISTQWPALNNALQTLGSTNIGQQWASSNNFYNRIPSSYPSYTSTPFFSANYNNYGLNNLKRPWASASINNIYLRSTNFMSPWNLPFYFRPASTNSKYPWRSSVPPVSFISTFKQPAPAPVPKPVPAPPPAPKPAPGPVPVPTPVTSKPITSKPITPKPITPKPVTPAPVTPAPVTPAPVTPAPKTPAPVTLATTTPLPIIETTLLPIETTPNTFLTTPDPNVPGPDPAIALPGDTTTAP